MFRPDTCLDVPPTDLLSWVFENVDEWPNRQIYIDASNPTHALTADDVRRNVRSIVAGLKARGIKRGDGVCVLSYNHIYYTSLYLGIIGAEACFVGANPAYTPSELQHLLSIANAKLVVVEPDLLASLLPAARNCGIADSDILILDHDRQVSLPRRTFGSWKTLLHHGVRWESFNDEQRAKDTVAALMLTSGTTGLPKAAAISHHAQVAQGMFLVDSTPKPYQVRRLMFLPQFHAFAAPLAHLVPLRQGHTTYVMKRYKTDEFIDHVRRHEITETAMVPPIVQGLLSQTSDRLDLLRTLRWVWCAGAQLSMQTQKRFASVLHPDAIFSQAWGMSETGWLTTFQFPERDMTGSVGRLVTNIEAKLLGVDGCEVTQDGGKGEILVRGPSLMSNYLGNSKASVDAFADGWLRTGDIAYCEGGKWFICDRAKEIIKVRGWQVSPTEIENCLLTHHAVQDAAVIGVHLDESVGEVPRAYIVPKPQCRSTLRSEDITAHVQGRLAKYKALTGGVVIVGSIDKSSSGKILRSLLKERTLHEPTKVGSVTA